MRSWGRATCAAAWLFGCGRFGFAPQDGGAGDDAVIVDGEPGIDARATAAPPIAAGAGGVGMVSTPGPTFRMRGLDGQPIDAGVFLGPAADPRLAFDGTRFGCAMVKSDAIAVVLITP